MNELSPRLLCRIFLILVLITTIILLSLPYSILALILLLVTLFIMLRPLEPRINIVITLAVIFLLPLIFEEFFRYLIPISSLPQMLIQFLFAIGVIPAIYLLDYNLRQNVQTMTLAYNSKGRHLTFMPKVLFLSILTMLLISFIIDNRVLLFTGIMLVLYLAFVLIRILYTISGIPVETTTTVIRVIAGNTYSISLNTINKESLRLFCLFSPVESWVKITPQRFTLNEAEIELNLLVTPTLAGPSHPQFRVSVMDSMGFIQLNYIIEPVELQVIPRAKYAKWLAIRFIEQNREQDLSGISAAATNLPKNALLPKRGTEYFDSRAYQPGDELKHIDWKHTLKLGQLIIKEFIGTGGQSVVIVVNLSSTNAEEADKLAFSLITTSLTLAQEEIPTALAVYNHQRVVLTTTFTDPKEILKQALLLVKDITMVESKHHFLQLPNIGKLRRNITRIQQAASEPGQRLLNMLNFEYQAIEHAVKNHPATLAILQVSEQISSPAIMVLVSQLNHDAEALMVTGERLTRKGFTIVNMEAAQP